MTPVRVSIRHSTHYGYDRRGSFAVQRLRLTPANNKAQTVRSWSIAAEGMEHAATYVDGFANRVHLITHCKPYDELTITAEGEVETVDTGGVVGEIGEVANPLLFLNATRLSLSSPEIDAMAGEAGEPSMLGRLHHILHAIAERVAYESSSTTSSTTAAEAFKAGRGVCQDHAHIFIAAARRLGVPARYVTGYLLLDGETRAVAHHAWAEAYLRSLGWVGFDPANAICPTDRYVRLACGFDAAAAAPIVGSRGGGGTETLSVDVVVSQQQQ